MLRRISPYVRGILFCVLAGPAIPAVVGAVAFWNTDNPIQMGGIFFGVIVFGLVVYSLPTAICVSLLIRDALRAANSGGSLESIKRKTASTGLIYGALIGLCFPLLLLVAEWVNPMRISGKSGLIGELLLVVFVVCVGGVLFAVPAGISGFILGNFLPSILGRTFRDALENRRPMIAEPLNRVEKSN